MEILRINNIEVDLSESLNAALNFGIADISDPSNRKSDFSKTIKLAGTKSINKVLASIFEINIAINTATFNPNKKADCIYIVDGETQIEGFIKLNNIIVEDTNKISYEVVIFGNLGNLFSDIGEAELTDLDFSEFDHEWTQANQIDSWDTQIIENAVPVPFAKGNGYVYPLLDYGFDNDTDNFDVVQLFPAIYEKTYVDKIFKAAGYTYTSNFLSTVDYNSRIIPFNRTVLELTNDEIESRLFDVEKNVIQSQILTAPSGAPNFDIVTFEVENNDPSNQFDQITDEFTAASAGSYVFKHSGLFNTTHTPSTGNEVFCNYAATLQVRIQNLDTLAVIATANIRSNPLGNFTGAYVTANPATPGDPDYFPNTNNPANSYTIVSPSVNLAAGERVGVIYQLFVNKLVFNRNLFRRTSNPNQSYGGSIQLDLHPTCTFSNLINDTTISEGNVITMNAVIPTGIKQKDLLKAIINSYNLYILPDSDNSKNLIIEPRDNGFYLDGQANTTDWTNKHSVNKDTELKPQGALKNAAFYYSYKEDNDFFNTEYTNEFSEIYGERTEGIDNDFLKDQNKTEIIYSPTPSVGNLANDRVIPRIFSVDSAGLPVPSDFNIRVLHYNGLLTASAGWTHTSGIVPSVIHSDYPYCGHFDHPFNPTLDLNFGLTQRIFWDDTFTPIVFPVPFPNLVNVYYFDFINQISSPDSKIVLAWMRLTPTDIATLNFRNLFYFNNSYFRLQRVIDYQATNEKLTQCEFIKVL